MSFKHIDSLKKENFNIKLKVHFLEERLAQLAPDQIDAALKQNINLKINRKSDKSCNCVEFTYNRAYYFPDPGLFFGSSDLSLTYSCWVSFSFIDLQSNRKLNL